MNNIYIYGNVLYRSMRHIKGKCSDKRMSRKFKAEVQNAVTLWNLCLTLLLDEAVNKTDNISILKKYLNSCNADIEAFYRLGNEICRHHHRRRHAKRLSLSDTKIFFDDTDENDTVRSYVALPTEAVGLMVKYIAEINICILDYKQNFRKINNYLVALHNLPRCLLNPRLKEYISQKEAIEYSQGWLKNINDGI